ncbi:MAG: hypothetical protein H7Y32_08365, partial [Chloroflexales bacterium]|nr:hypothetical protein [Chloroflexales bacterium]
MESNNSSPFLTQLLSTPIPEEAPAPLARTELRQPLVTQYIYLDQTSRHGRRASLALLGTAALLVVGLLGWFGAGRAALVFNAQADQLMAAGQFAPAEQRYGQAIFFSPRDGHALLNRGYARQRQGNDAGAIDDFGRVIAL